jgi:hypothetical protein
MPPASCVDYLNHRDTVTLAAGDAVHANGAIQTIDPVPYAAREKHILYDGQYLLKKPSQSAGCVVNCMTTIVGGGQAGAGAPGQAGAGAPAQY